MIVVTVELKSAIDESRSRHLGTLVIANDGKGTVAKGNYDVAFSGASGGPGKRGKVLGYPRKAVSIWNLVRRACEEAGYTK